MAKIVIIEKSGSVVTKKIKSFDVSNLYKSCNFRKNESFEPRIVWKKKKIQYILYSKNSGRESSINKYELPPPVDKVLYYGNICIIAVKSIKNYKLSVLKEFNFPKKSEIVDFTKEDWSKMYEKLMGGFENLGSQDTEEESFDSIPDEMKTKEGYMLDGFVVEDSGDEEDEESEEDNSDEENEIIEMDEELSEIEEMETDEETDFDIGDYEEDEETESDSELSEEEYEY